MQGVLLESGSADRYRPLGKSGHRVFDSAQQILAVIQRHPQLKAFFAIPQRNQTGSVIDWYSPVPGYSVSWGNATEAEQAQARTKLLAFCQEVMQLGEQQVEQGQKKNNADITLFGELLQEACKIPGKPNIYLIGQGGAGRQNHSAGSLLNAGGAGAAQAQAVDLQPVVTFWGFVDSEEALQFKPMYFLEPPAASRSEPQPLPGKSGVNKEVLRTSLTSGDTQIGTGIEKTITPITRTGEKKLRPVVVPWWRRWWKWLLLIPLLLLGLWLLRGCMPMGWPGGIGMSGGSGHLAPVPGGSGMGAGMPGGGTVHIPLPGGSARTTPMTPGTDMSGMGNTTTSLPVPSDAVPEGAPSMPAAGTDAAGVPPAPPVLPEEGASAPAGTVVPSGLPAASPQPADAAVPAQPDNSTSGLQIPASAPNGIADFLNGKYQTRGGLVDKDTLVPLQLHYDFKNGKGEVQIQRSGGVICRGDVVASMKSGVLGIDSQGAARCSDNTSYDLPQVQCKPDAGSQTDCVGVYDKSQIKIQMQGQ